MSYQLIVFDSHPVQYRVPIWQCIERQSPDILHVVYASDCSVRGFRDEGFGEFVAWDDPMLEGYSYTILNSEKGIPLSGWNSLTGKGVWSILAKYKPNAVLLTGLNYRYDLTVLIYSKLRSIPVWLRCETQDFSTERSTIKSIVRGIIYRLLYKAIDIFFYIGQLNQIHYLNHGVDEIHLFPAKYCTINRYKGMSEAEKSDMRKKVRRGFNITKENIVIGFSGKFIAKKNPKIIYQMLQYLPQTILSKLILYFVGSGDLENDLLKEARDTESKYGVRSIFTGFVNQSEIGTHYLAMDIFILPSKKMGETWGLVVNEAMQAGCGVVVSNAVGCSRDFELWERFKVFREGDAVELAKHVTALTSYERNFDWAIQQLVPYSIEATANAFIEALKKQDTQIRHNA